MKQMGERVNCPSIHFLNSFDFWNEVKVNILLIKKFKSVRTGKGLRECV